MSEIADPTPVTQPGKLRPGSSSGLDPVDELPAADEFPFEDTGRFSSNIYDRFEATAPEEGGIKPEQFIDFLAHKIAEHGGGGSGDQPEKHAKSIKKHNLITILLAFVLGPGGAIAVIYATSDRAKANSQDVEYLKDASKSLEPRVKQTEADIGAIRIQVESVGSTMSSVKAEQKTIIEGITELKEENVNRLKNELDEARREIRRRDRERDR